MVQGQSCGDSDRPWAVAVDRSARRGSSIDGVKRGAEDQRKQAAAYIRSDQTTRGCRGGCEDWKVAVMDALIGRLAFLVEVADRKQDLEGRLGKTAMQKLLYLLQEVYGVDLGYRFDVYTDGPYEAAIMRDIDYAEALELLALDYDHDRGYEIVPGRNAAELEEERNQIQQEKERELGDLFANFGSLTARELELQSTFVYVSRDQQVKDGRQLLRLVKEIKPKYEESELQEALQKLSDLDVLQLR